MTKLIQQNGQPHFGRLADYPSQFNIEDYQNSFLSHRFIRRLRYKKFRFIAVQHPQYHIGLAIADLGWAGHAFYYCYHRDSQRCLDLHAIQLLPQRFHVAEIADTQRSYFKHRQLHIELSQQQATRYVQVKKARRVLCEVKIDTQAQPALNLCTPTGVRGFSFTHKNTCLTVSGEFYGVDRERIALDYRSLASVDDSCGFFRPETEWFWLSSQYQQAEQRIGINLASGVNESISNENCLWLDGVLWGLPDVIFHQLDQNTWRIYSLNGQVELMAHTSWRRYEDKNLFIVASQFSQWISVITGTIQINGRTMSLDNVAALLEQHFARW